MKISDFIMFENAPYKLPEPKAFIELTIGAIKEEVKTYGPAYNVKFIKNALEFAAKKVGAKLPKDIKNLNQLADYLISISHKYPVAYSVIPYASMKTEKEFQGKIGAITQIGSMSVTRSTVESPSREERNVGLDELISKYRQTLIGLGVATYEFGYKKNKDESVIVIWPECFLKDGCRAAFDDGFMQRMIGGLQCNQCLGIFQIFKLLTGYDWDYKLLEFDKPHCIANIFML